MPKRTFTREQLRDILFEDFGGVTLLNKMVSQTRWETHFRFVFRADDDEKLYETTYSKGSTESQDRRPWDYQDETACVEVESYEKTITDYRPVE